MALRDEWAKLTPTEILSSLVAEVAYQVRVMGSTANLPDWAQQAVAKGIDKSGPSYRCEFDCDRCHDDCETTNCVCETGRGEDLPYDEEDS